MHITCMYILLLCFLITKTLFFFSYETSNGLFNDMDCQKKAICEVYQNAQQLGAVSQRARHSLDNLETLSLLSLPDEFMNIIDEFVVSLF